MCLKWFPVANQLAEWWIWSLSLMVDDDHGSMVDGDGRYIGGKKIREGGGHC